MLAYIRRNRSAAIGAIDEFVAWYCSEPRFSFNKTVVTRYRIHLEDRRLTPGTTNVRLAAVRRLADEAADAGLLSTELAAGIRRVKGSKRLGVRLERVPSNTARASVPPESRTRTCRSGLACLFPIKHKDIAGLALARHAHSNRQGLEICRELDLPGVRNLAL